MVKRDVEKYRLKAIEKESRASRSESKGVPRRGMDPSTIAFEYNNAAYNYLKANEPKKAMNCYFRAAQSFERSVELYQEVGHGHSYSPKSLLVKAQQARKNAEKIKKNLGGNKNSLESITTVTAIVGFLGAILFSFSNLTGNVIGVNQVSSNWIGGILFIIGLIGAFAYFRRK